MNLFYQYMPFLLVHSASLDFLFHFLFLLLLIAINGWFVSSEFALVSLRRTRIDELAKKGDKKAKLLQRALDNLPEYISATQFGITLVSIALGWIGEPAIAGVLQPFFTHLFPIAVATVTSYTISLILAFAIITFFQIVLGELTPKTIALQKTEKIAMLNITFLILFMTAFRPFIWVINAAGKLILRILRIPDVTENRIQHSEEEIKMILSQSARSGMIEEQEAEMVYKIFRLDDMTIAQIMLPLRKIIAFDINTPVHDIIKQIKQSNHNRFPVFEKSRKNIIGLVHIKDIYRLALKGNFTKHLSDTKILCDITNLDASFKADDALLLFRSKRVHMAVIKNKKNEALGIITIEDIVKSIVGEIREEIKIPIKSMYHTLERNSLKQR